MKKLLVLAIVIALSFSLVWAAETIKDTQLTASKGKVVTQTAPESQAKTVTPAPKAPRAAKAADDSPTIDPNAISAPVESPASTTAKQSTETKSKDVPAGFVGDANKANIAAEADGKWQPIYGEKGELLNPEPVINFVPDQNDQDPPVITETQIFFENFSWGTGWNPTNMLNGWTTTMDAGGSFWDNYDLGCRYASTTWGVAYVRNYSAAGTGRTIDDWIISPSVDFSAATACSLNYRYYFDAPTTLPARQWAYVMLSDDGGLTWPFTVKSWTAVDSGTSSAPRLNRMDVSAFAAGKASVMAAFRFVRDTTVTSGYFGFDNVEFTADGVSFGQQTFDETGWGWAADNASWIGPTTGWAGWTGIDNVDPTAPASWNNNDWHYFYSATSSWGDTVADIYYIPDEFSRDKLVSPIIDLTGQPAVSLRIRHFFDWGAAGDSGLVLGTNDGWATTQVVAVYQGVDYGSGTVPDLGLFDLTSWAANQSAVQLAFQWIRAGGSSGRSWAIGDVELFAPDQYDVLTTAVNVPTILHDSWNWPLASTVLNNGSATVTFQDSTYIEQPNKNVVFHEGFGNPVGWTGANPPTGWTVLDSGSVPGWDNQDWHQFYYSSTNDTLARVVYLSGVTQREWLISPSANATTLANVHLNFRTYFNWEGSTDTAYIYGSTDNWATKIQIAKWAGADIGSSSALSVQDFDISAWAVGQANVQVAFMYWALYDQFWYVDDVEIYESLPPTVVHTAAGTVTNLAYGASATVAHTPTWNTPAPGSYNVRQFTALVGDVNTANDAMLGTTTVYAHTGTGGPDAGFYTFIDNTQGGGPAFSWIDMTGSTSITFSSTDGGYSYGLPLGGSFKFYGTNYDSVYASCDGLLSFTALSGGFTTNYGIPSASGANNMIAFMWDDMQMYPAVNPAAYYLYDAINNRFVVEYDNIQFYGSPNSDTIDAQVILDLDDYSIVVQYANIGTALQTDATVGIENVGGTIGLQYYFDTNLGNYPYSGLAIQYIYTPPALDVSIASFDGPNGLLFVGTPYTMTATAANLTSNASTFDVEFYADAVLVGSVTGINLAGFGTQLVTCPNTWSSATTGAHTLSAKTVMPGDAAPGNDEIQVTRSALGAPVALPFTSDLEANNGGFVGTNEWEWGTPTLVGPTAAHSPVNLWGTDLDAYYDANLQSVLYFPPFDLTTAVAPNLKFWMWRNSESTYDGANVKVSVDNGATWNIVTTSVAYNGALSLDNPTMGGQQAWYGSLDWTEVSFSLAPYIGGTLLVKIDFGADPSVQYAGFYIDDITVQEPPSDDIGVTAILSPGTISIQGFSWAVASQVHNYGGVTKFNVPVQFNMYDVLGNLVYNQTYTLTQIEAGVDSIVEFPDWAPAEPDTHRFVSYSMLAGDIDGTNDTARVTSYTYPHNGTGSANNWTFADNINGGGPAFNWIDITTLGTPITWTDPDDGNSGMIAMGINFNFFNTVYSRVNVNADGWLSFVDSTLTGSNTYTNVAIPVATAPNALVALLWDDLHIGTGTVYYYTDVVENQFIVTYHNVEYYSSGGPDCIDMQVIFDADNNSIKMQYNNFCTGSQTDVTVGVENVAGTAGLAYDNNGEIGQTPLNGVAVTFTYAPPATDVVFDHTVGQVGAAGSIPVCAVFENVGADASNVTANFVVNDGTSDVFTGSGSGTVPAGGFATICASSNWTATPGEYTITVTATASDDVNPGNNNGSGDIQIVGGAVPIPYVQNFESTVLTFPPADWTILHYGASSLPNGTWQADTMAYRSPITAAFQDDDPNAVKDEWLVMRPMDFTSAFLPVWKFYEDGLYWGSYGVAHEFYVGTGPVFDINTATMVAQHTPANHTVSTFDGNPGGSFDMAAYNGSAIVWCAFRYIGEWSDEWYIDDISVLDMDQFDASVADIYTPNNIVDPGDPVPLEVTLINYGYQALTADLTTVGVGTTSGTIYNNLTTGIAMAGFDTVVVTLPPMTTTAGCGEAFNITSTVAAAGDTIVDNNMQAITVSTAFLYQGNIVPGPYYYWPQVWYYLRQMTKPTEGVITHAVIDYQDTSVPRVFFDFFIFGADPGGTPNRDTLYYANVQAQYPFLTVIDIQSIYPTLPDTFFFAVKNTFGNTITVTGPISDQGQMGGLGSYRARNDSLNYLAFAPYTMDFTTIIDERGASFLDLSADVIDAPGSVVIGDGPFPVSGMISNVGTTDVIGGSAHMVITGPGGTDFDATVTGINLAIGASAPVSFGTWTPSVGGVTYDLTLTASVAGEGDACNNVTTASCLAITGQTAVFEDFETDNGGFAGSPVWEYGAPTVVGPTPYSGVNVWGTVLADNYPIDACDSLRTPAYTVPAAGGAMVIYVWYDSELDWDGFNIKMSVNGGAYNLVTPIGGYDLVEQGYLCDLMISQPYFTGASGAWVPKAVDLTALAGQSVSFSFDFGSDGSVVAPGAYLDDFTIYDFATGPQGCVYTPGDINGNGLPTASTSFTASTTSRASIAPPVVCDMCPQTSPFYAAGDVNGNCAFNGIDITFFVNYLKGVSPPCSTARPARRFLRPRQS